MAGAADRPRPSAATPEAAFAGALSHPPLRLTRLRNGYRIADVELVLAALQLLAREREGENERLQRELGELRAQIGVLRGREQALADAEAEAHRRASTIEEEARERARRVVDEAELDAQDIRGSARLRIDETAAEFDELMRLKEGLLRSLRALVREFQESVERVARGEPLALPAARAPLERGEDESRGYVADEVEVIAGPFHDFASLSRFEQAVGKLPHVTDVYVRHFASDRAVIEVSLGEPTPLEDELARLLPFPVEVSRGSDGTILVDVAAEGHSAARNGAR